MLRQYFIWLMISLLIGFGFYLLLPYPVADGIPISWGLVATLLFWMLLPFTVRSEKLRRLARLDKFYGKAEEDLHIKYYCLRCGVTYKGKKCPVCKSTNRKAVF